MADEIEIFCALLNCGHAARDRSDYGLAEYWYQCAANTADSFLRETGLALAARDWLLSLYKEQGRLDEGSVLEAWLIKARQRAREAT